jgi:hypothetical protein
MSSIQRCVLRVCAHSVVLAALLACQPTVRVQAPTEPITVNLNIKLDADVRVHLEQAARDDIAGNKELF